MESDRLSVVRLRLETRHLPQPCAPRTTFRRSDVKHDESPGTVWTGQREQIGLLAVVSVVIILFLIVRARMSRSN